MTRRIKMYETQIVRSGKQTILHSSCADELQSASLIAIMSANNLSTGVCTCQQIRVDFFAQILCCMNNEQCGVV